ncbi:MULTISPECIES: hypothetical protein [Mycolicibacterium]|uniref:Uncharacterized protein n=1 Tax=Mycolicibacterium porcinum TaxID=39693 RepID=A0ABV3VNC5_9MYCO
MNHLVVERDSVVDLVADLNVVSCDTWAAAVLDDDQIVVTNDRADAYISPGVHLPHNITLIASNCPDDGVFWQTYGWPPAERLATYARHFGWLNRITTLVAERGRPQWSDTEGKRVPTDVFEWVRPVLDHHDVELLDFDLFQPNRDRRDAALCELLVHGPNSESGRKARKRLGQPPLGSVRRGGRHRLDVINPARYQDLVHGDQEQVLAELAAVTVEAAENALARSHPAFASRHGERIFLGDLRRNVDAVELQRQILEIVAATDPADIVSRRLEAISSPDIFIGHDTGDAIGFPAGAAPAWAEYITAAYGSVLGGARGHASGWARFHYEAVRGYWSSRETDPAAKALNIYVSAECVAIALETIWLWTQDPLPVPDIEYAARMLAN